MTVEEMFLLLNDRNREIFIQEVNRLFDLQEKAPMSRPTKA